MMNRVKVITWNMGGFRFQKKQAQAWAYLENTLKPDIALLQEVGRSKFDSLCADGRAFAYQGSKFGTMIFCRDDFARKVRQNEALSLCSSEVYISAVDLLGLAEPLSIMSVHVNPDKMFKANLRKLVEILGQALRTRPIIVGGDFNACRRYDVVHKKNVCGWFFEEMKKIGFFDCHYGLHGEEKRTYWSKKTSEPYQDDHFFAPANWKGRIISCDVLPYDSAKRLSDHGPAELIIELPKMI
jgi:exonuclease III